MVMKCSLLLLQLAAVEIEGMKDTSGGIQFHKVIEHLLPRFEDTKAGQQSL